MTAQASGPVERRDTVLGAGSGRRLLAAAGIVVLVLVAYHGAFDNPFFFDDHATVIGNRSLEDLSNWKWILVYERFRPLVNVSHAFERAAFGLEPGPYHAVNVVLHAVICLMAAALARGVVSDARGAEHGDAAGLLVGVLFAVHPLFSSAAGYVSARATLLCGVLLLGAVLTGRRAVRGGGKLVVAATVLLGLLALLAKETAAVLPVLLWMDDGFLAARAGHAAAAQRRQRRLWIPLLLLMLGAAAFRVYHFGDETRFPRHLAWRYALAQPGVVWRYLGLLVLPLGQSIAHDVPWPRRPTQASCLVALAGLLALLLGSLRQRRRNPALAYGLLWFFGVIAPAASIVPLVERMAEHRAYLPCIGILIAVASEVVPAAAAWGARTRRAAVAGLAALVVLLSLLTVRRNEVMGDPMLLWTEALASAPELFAPHYWVGETYRERGDCEQALDHFLDALPLYPLEPLVYEGIAACLKEVGSRDERAEPALVNASQIVKALPGPWICRALIARRQDNPALVEALIREAGARCAAQERPHRVCDLLVSPRQAGEPDP